MNNIQYKIRIRENTPMLNYAIYMFKDTPAGRYMIYQDEDIQTEKLILDNSIGVKPTLYLQRDMLQEMLVEITNIGIKLPEQSKIEGQLEAQTSHLQDLRKLLKLS